MLTVFEIHYGLDMCLFVATGSPSLNPHARPWLPGSGKDDRPEEGCYQPDIPVRYYTQEQVDDLLMKKEGEVVLYQGQENKLLRQNRTDVQRNLDKSRAKVKRQTEVNFDTTFRDLR